jgi:hypothetical protein
MITLKKGFWAFMIAISTFTLGLLFGGELSNQDPHPLIWVIAILGIVINTINFILTEE